MKEHVETIPERDHLSIRSSVQDITGQPFKLMAKHMSRSVINVNGSVTSLDNHRSTLSHDGPMAFCTVGVGYFGSLPNWDQTNEIFGGGN